MEIIYTGLRRTVKQVVNTAIQEDVNVIGLSLLSGTHLKTSEKIIKSLKEEGVDDKLLIVGGVVPDEDIPVLKEMGVNMVFTQSSSFDEMIQYISENA